MTDTTQYERSSLEQADKMVPLGIYVASDGSVIFDSSDAMLLEDAAAMVHAFVALHPDNNGKLFALNGVEVKTSANQRERMTNVLRGILQQMGAPDGGDPHKLDTMLASAFDRFPQFADFSALAAGSGDLITDPLHPDRAISDQLTFNHGSSSR